MDEQEQRKSLVSQICGILGHVKPFSIKNRIDVEKPTQKIEYAPKTDPFYLSNIIKRFDQGEYDNLSKQSLEVIKKKDFEKHYELGVIYRELGYLEDAIKEFDLASCGDKERLKAVTMEAYSYMENRQYHLAVKQLERGFAFVGIKPAEERAEVQFGLALVYELLGNEKLSTEYYHKACSILNS